LFQIEFVFEGVLCTLFSLANICVLYNSCYNSFAPSLRYVCLYMEGLTENCHNCLLISYGLQFSV